MPYVPVPSHLDVVQAVWARLTPEQRCTPARVANNVAWELRTEGLDYYINQKRGTQGDSEDAISTPHPQGAGGWAVIDIIAGFRAGVIGAGSPVWIDQTQATIDAGTVGGGRLPTNPGSGPPPAPDVTARVAALETQLAAMQSTVRELTTTVAGCASVVGALTDRLTTLESQPTRYRIVGRTGKSRIKLIDGGNHDHDVAGLRLERIP